MRKFISLALGCMVGISLCRATPTNVPLSSGGEPEIMELPQKAPARFPQVSYEGQNLYIESPYYIDEAEIIIRDAAGNIIFDEVTALPAASYVIPLSDDVVANKYSIDVIYGYRHLRGYF